MYLVVCWTGHGKQDRTDAIPKYLTKRLKNKLFRVYICLATKKTVSPNVTKYHQKSAEVT